MSELYFKIGTLTNLKLGISTYAIRILAMYPFRVNWRKLEKILQDKRIFYIFNSYEDFLRYVLSNATYFINVANVTTRVSEIFKYDEKLKPYAEYMVTPKELEFIYEIYNQIISKSIFNAKRKNDIFDFDITLEVDKINNVYIDQNIDSFDKVDKFMRALECFAQYNQFLWMGYDADFYSCNSTMTLNFFEDS